MNCHRSTEMSHRTKTKRKEKESLITSQLNSEVFIFDAPKTKDKGGQVDGTRATKQSHAIKY